MRKKIFLFLILSIIIIPISKVKAIDLTYQAHVQSYGWMEAVNEEELAGTTGKSKRMEAIKINLNNDTEYEGSITYQAHVQSYGWMDWVNNGEMAGTTGKSKRIEAIKINLTSELKNHYFIKYRVHVQSYGWMDWVKDGELAGTTGESKRIEAIEIKLVQKDNRDLTASYSVHNSDGWGEYVKNGEQAGTTGESKKIDLIKIKLNNNTNYTGGITYQTYSTTNGWLNTVSENKESGLSNNTLEAIKINLTGDFEKYFNIFYRVHSSTIGWMDWTNNGKPAGSIGYFYKIEAIEIKILPKDDESITISDNAYKEYNNKVLYSTHVQSYGWQNYVSNGETSGTTGESKRVEALKIKLDTAVSGNIIYKTYISRRGWSSESKNDAMSGTSGLSRTLEGISIKLDGKMADNYDIYYRVHMQSFGWLSWAKNGDIAGCFNSDKRMEAIEIKLVIKGSNVSLDTSKPYVTGTWKNNNTNYYDATGKKATGFKLIDGVKYYFNSDGTLYGKNVNKVIDISSWQGSINWDTIKKQDDVDAAIIRVGWGTSTTDECGLDSYFDNNIKAVQRLGIPYSIYIYAYAVNTSAAEKEANFVISKMKQYNIPKSTFVWYDAEIQSYSKSTYETVIPAFINKMKANGYSNIGVYSSVSQLDTTNGNLNSSKIRNYPIWVAQYYKKLQYTGTYKGWQFSSTETIDGISGNVDVSMFKK